MGYYIPNGVSIETRETVERIPCPKNFNEIPNGKALIVEVDNAFFKAYGYAYNENEFKAFTEPHDNRRKAFYLMDESLAKKLSNF